MMFETRKILGDESIAISVTCARVPVTYSHSESVNVQTREPLEVEEARALLAAMPGASTTRRPATRRPPARPAATRCSSAASAATRRTSAGCSMWVVSDNLRKGAATNAVQLAELLHERGLVGARAPRRLTTVNGGLRQGSVRLPRGETSAPRTGRRARRSSADGEATRGAQRRSLLELPAAGRAVADAGDHGGRPVDHRRRLDDVLGHARAPSARARARGRRAAAGAAPASRASRPTTFSAPRLLEVEVEVAQRARRDEAVGVGVDRVAEVAAGLLERGLACSS